MDGGWRERLRDFFRQTPDQVQLVEARGPRRCVQVSERSDEGRAELRLTLDPDALGLAINLGNQEAFPFLASAKNPDGALLIQDAAGRWEAVVVELKKTIDGKVLVKMEEQVRWGLVRLEMIAAFLGISVSARRAIVGTREDRLGVGPDPALARLPLGSHRSPESVQAVQGAAQRWRARRLPDPFVRAAGVPVEPVLLNSEGEADHAVGVAPRGTLARPHPEEAG